MILEVYFSRKPRLIGFHMEPPTSLFSKYGVLEQKEYASYFHSLRIDMVRIVITTNSETRIKSTFFTAAANAFTP